MFDYLALGAVVDGRVFCVHGGLSPNLQGIDQVSHSVVSYNLVRTLTVPVRFAVSTVSRKCLMTDRCVIYCGLTQTVRQNHLLVRFLREVMTGKC